MLHQNMRWRLRELLEGRLPSLEPPPKAPKPGKLRGIEMLPPPIASLTAMAMEVEICPAAPTLRDVCAMEGWSMSFKLPMLRLPLSPPGLEPMLLPV